MQHAPLANAACCIFHSTARQYCGEASSPSKPLASCCFLIPSEKSCQCLFSCGPVPSAALGCASCYTGLSCSLARASAFCCAGLCVLLYGSFVFSCTVLCPLLRGSELSLVRFSAFFCVNQWRGRCGLSQWKWRGDGTVELGAAGRGFPVGGFGEIDRCFEKKAQQAGLTQPLRLLVRRDRDSNPGYSHPYAAFRVRSIRPLWHLSSSGSAALPVPCARGWWWRPWSNPFRSAKLLQPFHSNKHWSEKASPGQGVFIFGADGLCSLSRGFLLF